MRVIIVRERENWLLGMEVISAIKKHPITLEQICMKIYRNTQAKNLVRIYICVMVLLKNEIVTVLVKDGMLLFKMNEKKEEKL